MRIQERGRGRGVAPRAHGVSGDSAAISWPSANTDGTRRDGYFALIGQGEGSGFAALGDERRDGGQALSRQ